MQVWNGGNRELRSKEELAALLSDPQLWGNLEVGVESKGQVASVLRGPADAGPQLLVRIDGLSPLGAESPATCVVLDGGGEPRTIACRYLIHVERAVHILSRYAETGTRPTLDEAGQPLLWGNPVVSREGWETIGRLDEFPLDEDVLSLVYWERPDAEDIETHQDEPPSKPLGIHLTGRALTEDEASRLPHTGLWPLLRGLFHISDPRWFELLAAHPMAWLRDLAVSTPEITRLADALAAMPRILELQLVAPLDPEAIPALASPSLRTLVLGVGSARAVQAILDRMSFPRLRTLVLHDDEIDAPLDLTRLGQHVVVMVDEPSPARLAHVASARHLSIRPGEDVTPDELVDALAPRRKRRTHLSMMWDGAEEAVELATELGLRVSAS